MRPPRRRELREADPRRDGQRPDRLDPAAVVDEQARRGSARIARPPSGPDSSAALAFVSASTAVSPSAVTPIRPVQAGSPVDGSSRWCA